MLAIDRKGYAFNADQGALISSLINAQLYRCLSAPGLVIGSVSAKTLKITNTTVYLHNGIFKSMATQVPVFTATTHDIAPHATLVQEAVYLVCNGATASDICTVHMGAISSGAGTALFPDVPAGKTPIGAVRIAVAAGATLFDATTDDLSAGHITDTYYDIGFLHPLVGAAQ
jgi:hypothetical protein